MPSDAASPEGLLMFGSPPSDITQLCGGKVWPGVLQATSVPDSRPCHNHVQEDRGWLCLWTGSSARHLRAEGHTQDQPASHACAWSHLEPGASAAGCKGPGGRVPSKGSVPVASEWGRGWAAPGDGWGLTKHHPTIRRSLGPTT